VFGTPVVPVPVVVPVEESGSVATWSAPVAPAAVGWSTEDPPHPPISITVAVTKATAEADLKRLRAMCI
jgi:hypothetical protein